MRIWLQEMGRKNSPPLGPILECKARGMMQSLRQICRDQKWCLNTPIPRWIFNEVGCSLAAGAKKKLGRYLFGGSSFRVLDFKPVFAFPEQNMILFLDSCSRVPYPNPRDKLTFRFILQGSATVIKVGKCLDLELLSLKVLFASLHRGICLNLLSKA